MKYDLSELEVVWRKGDGEMPENVKHVVNAAREEKFLRALNLSPDDENTIKYNAVKSDKTVFEYVSSLVMTSLHPA